MMQRPLIIPGHSHICALCGRATTGLGGIMATKIGTFFHMRCVVDAADQIQRAERRSPAKEIRLKALPKKDAEDD